MFDPTSGLYIRFPAFSGSHGWQWFREIYLNDTSVWTYDLATNTWRNRRRDAVRDYEAEQGDIGWVLDDNQGMNAVADAIEAKVNRVYQIYDKAL